MTSDTGCEDLRRRNEAAFERYHPALLAALRALEQTATRVIRDDTGRPVDIDLGSRRLYERPAAAHAADQVSAYIASPRRLLVAHAVGASQGSPIAQRMLQHLIEQLEQRGSHLLDAPRGPVGALVVFGVGLGEHLPALIEHCQAQTVFILEPHLEFLGHSLETCDWAALYAAAEAQQRTLTIITDEDPAQAFFNLDHSLVQEGGYFLDGSYLFTHYPSWHFAEINRRLAENANHYFIVPGYYEDEEIMVTRATGNFLRTPFHLLEPAYRTRRDEPVFIVGSGPSLDESLEVIRRWRDHAVVVSCGTALQAMLANGIRPDLHCELENGEVSFRVLSHTRDKFDFAGIRLIASATVYHRIPPMFDGATLFFRDSVASSQTYGRGRGILLATAPTVTNTAFTVVTTLGFRTIYLFGVDCGGRQRQKQHCSGTIYQTMGAGERPWTLEVPGNFGGTVGTEWVYDLTRRMLQLAQKVKRADLYNCSNGALIEGAIPKLPQTLRLQTPVLDKARVISEVMATMPFYEPGAFLADRPVSQYIQACRDFAVRAEAALAAPVTDFPTLHRTLVDLVLLGERDYHGVVHMVSGSAMALLKIGQFCINRIAEDDIRDVIFTSFLEKYRELMREMLEGAGRVFAAAEEEFRRVDVR